MDFNGFSLIFIDFHSFFALNPSHLAEYFDLSVLVAPGTRPRGSHRSGEQSGPSDRNIERVRVDFRRFQSDFQWIFRPKYSLSTVFP